MEVSEEILLNLLSDSGVSIPAGVSSVGELTAVTLFTICSHSLLFIDGPQTAPSFCPSLPDDSLPDRVKICTDLADAFNNLGFKPDLSFHKFLYPSKEDLYKLVRFLVGKLSKSSEARTASFGDSVQNQVILNVFKDLKLRNQTLESPSQRDGEPNSVLNNVDIRVEEYQPIMQDSSSNECSRAGHSESSEGVQSSRNNDFRDQYSSQNKKVLEKLSAAKYSELEHPDEKLFLLNETAEMVLDGQYPVESYIEELNEQVQTKRDKLKELESDWDAIEQPLQDKKGRLEQLMFACHSEPSGELKRMKDIELETESIIAQIKRREEELSKISSDVEKQPKLVQRRSYIERINGITKNIRKQEYDVQRILKDTRELQLESNTIQERLNRTYAIVDETVFREAKKDLVAQQAYRLLTKIHKSFEQVAERILAADRSRRDAADLEAKLAIIRVRSFKMAKLQADLDAIRKENELLEQQLQKI